MIEKGHRAVSFLFLYIHHKMILIAVYETFLFHFTYLGGESASVDLEVIGELLTVKGNIKRSLPRFLHLKRQVREQLFPCGAL